MDIEVTVDETQSETDTPVIPVIVETPPDNTPVLFELVERVTRLEGRADEFDTRLNDVANRAVNAQYSAEDAANTAEVAIDIASGAEQAAIDATELVLETADETGVLDTVLEETDTAIEVDATPHKPHLFFDDWAGIKRRISGN